MSVSSSPPIVASHIFCVACRFNVLSRGSVSGFRSQKLLGLLVLICIIVASFAVAITTANLVPPQVFVVAAAVGSIASDGGSDGAAGASDASVSGAQTWQRQQHVWMAASVVAAAPIGIVTMTTLMVITITVAVPVFVRW